MSTISASTTSTTAYKVTADTTGTLVLQTGSTPTTAATFDANQNMGLGVTPSAWNTASKAIQLGAQGAIEYRGNATSIAMNAYYDSTGWKYIASNAASLYFQYLNTHNWQIAASGTAGNAITFTQAMTLDSGGRLQLGTTSLTGGLMNFGNTASTTSIAHTWADTVYSTYMGFDSTYYMGTMYNAAGREVRLVANSNDSNGKITFYTGGSGTPSERARITDVGNIVFGSTSAGLTNNNAFWISPPAGYFGQNHINGAASGTAYVYFGYNGSGIGTISQNGTTAVAYNTSSDYRLKHDIAPMTGALAKVAALKPCTYKWNADNSDGEGFIAHELAEVCPHAVTGEKDATRIEQYEISPAVPATFDEEGNELTPAVEAVMGEREVPVYQGIDTSFLVATLTAAIQEQQAIIETLTNRITALEAK